MFENIPSSPRVTKILRFQVQRAEIERRSTKRALRWLHALVADRDTAWASRNSLVVEVIGYDSDSRELWEIPEVRRFFRKLHGVWPYWFFFASHFAPTLTVLQNCIVGCRQVRPGVVEVDSEQAQHFLEYCTGAMNHLFDHYEFPEEELNNMFFSMLDYMKSQQAAL